jgi:hypothetical protein
VVCKLMEASADGWLSPREAEFPFGIGLVLRDPSGDCSPGSVGKGPFSDC